MDELVSVMKEIRDLLKDIDKKLDDICGKGSHYDCDKCTSGGPSQGFFEKCDAEEHNPEQNLKENVELGNGVVLERMAVRSVDEILKKIREETPLENLGLSSRAYNCLTRAGIDTIEDLTRVRLSDISRCRNMGKKTLAEVKSKMLSYGLDFAPEDIGRYYKP